MVASRPRGITQVLREAQQTHEEIERWMTTLTTLITQARAERDIIRDRPEEGVIPDAGDSRRPGPHSRSS